MTSLEKCCFPLTQECSECCLPCEADIIRKKLFQFSIEFSLSADTLHLNNNTNHYTDYPELYLKHKHCLGISFYFSVLVGTSDLELTVSSGNVVHMSGLLPLTTHVLCHLSSTKPSKLHSDFCGIIITSIWGIFSKFW